MINDSITRTLNFEDLRVGDLVRDTFYDCNGIVTEVVTQEILHGFNQQPYAHIAWIGTRADYCDSTVRWDDVDCLELLNQGENK